MEPKNQTQNQRSGSDNNSQSQSNPLPKPKPQPPVKQPKDLVEKDKSSEKEDIQTDERPTSETRIGKAQTDEEQIMPKPKDNEGWQTGDSGIPENASDNPNS